MPVPVCIFPTLHDSSAKPRFALVVALDGLGHLQLIKQRIVGALQEAEVAPESICQFLGEFEVCHDLVTALRVAQQWVEIA
jgi:hypothetical protein